MIKTVLNKLYCAFAFTILLCLFVLPISANDDVNEMNVDIDDRAGAVYLYNYESDRVLVSHRTSEPMLPASTAKMMTGIVVCENYFDKLDESVIITEQMLDGHTGTSMNLQVGMEVTIRTLLHGTICGGNNDAALALAIACSGSIRAFVDEMNQFANRLYMNDTHYKNPTGLDANDARTTLADVARLARYVSKNKLYVSISSLPSFTFYANGTEVSTVYNRNALHSQFSAAGYVNKYATGLNAGSTDNGGYVLATLAQKNDMTYLCVVMGASADASNIYSYSTANQILSKAFDNYSLQKIASAGDIFAEPETTYTLVDGTAVKLPCAISSDLNVVLKDGTKIKDDITYKIYFNDNTLSAPIRAGDVVGGVNVYCKDVLVGRAILLAASDVEPNLILYSLKQMKDFISGRVFIIGFLLSIVSVFLYVYFDSKNLRYKKVKTVRYSKFS